MMLYAMQCRRGTLRQHFEWDVEMRFCFWLLRRCKLTRITDHGCMNEFFNFTCPWLFWISVSWREEQFSLPVKKPCLRATWPWSPSWATWFPTWQVSTAMMGTRPVWQMVTTDMALAQWHPALRPSSLMQWLHITLTTSCHQFHQRRCTKVTRLTWTNLNSHCWQHGAQRWMWASTRRRKARRRKASECESAQVQWYKTYRWSQ